MKKIVAISTVTVLACSLLAGCGGKKADSTSEVATKEAEAGYTVEALFGDYDYEKYVTLADYKNVSATMVEYNVSDDEVQNEIQSEVEGNADYKDISDRGVIEGDYVNVDYKGTIDGEEFDGSSEEDCDIQVGNGDFLPEIEDALIDKKTGDSFNVDAELTEDFFTEEYVGKKATFEVTVNSVQEEVLPEYNLDYVKENTDFDTIADYEASIKENLLATKEDDYKTEAQNEALSTIVDNSKFNGYPDELYEQSTSDYNASKEYYAQMLGITAEEYDSQLGITEDIQKEEILGSVNQILVLGAIAKKENISITKKDAENFVDKVYEEYGYESAAAFRADYDDAEINYEVLYEKILDFIYDNANLTMISEAEYKAKQEEQEAEVEEADQQEDMEDAGDEAESDSEEAAQ